MDGGGREEEGKEDGREEGGAKEGEWEGGQVVVSGLDWWEVCGMR